MRNCLYATGLRETASSHYHYLLRRGHPLIPAPSQALLVQRNWQDRLHMMAESVCSPEPLVFRVSSTPPFSRVSCLDIVCDRWRHRVVARMLTIENGALFMFWYVAVSSVTRSIASPTNGERKAPVPLKVASRSLRPRVWRPDTVGIIRHPKR